MINKIFLTLLLISITMTSYAAEKDDKSDKTRTSFNMSYVNKEVIDNQKGTKTTKTKVDCGTDCDAGTPKDLGTPNPISYITSIFTGK